MVLHFVSHCLSCPSYMLCFFFQSSSDKASQVLLLFPFFSLFFSPSSFLSFGLAGSEIQSRGTA
jgi:hypothetical protein